MVVFPLPQNITGLLSLAVYTNTVTEGWFGTLMLLFIDVVLYLSLSQNTKQKNAFVVIGFLNIIFMALFWEAGILNLIGVILSVLIFAGSLIYLYAKRDLF